MFKNNQVVKANKDITFSDLTKHYKNKKYIVTQDTLSYYICNSKDYTLI